MKKEIEKFNSKKIAQNITNTIEADLFKIMEVLDFDFNEVISNVNNLPEKSRIDVMSILINDSLKELQEKLDIAEYSKVIRYVDDVTDYYKSKKDDFESIIEECDMIADDILYKVMGHKDRKLELPIDVSIIEKYCFSTEIKKEQFYDALMWIALRYIATLQYLKYKNWKNKYNEENNIEVVN